MIYYQYKHAYDYYPQRAYLQPPNPMMKYGDVLQVLGWYVHDHQWQYVVQNYTQNINFIIKKDEFVPLVQPLTEAEFKALIIELL